MTTWAKQAKRHKLEDLGPIRCAVAQDGYLHWLVKERAKFCQEFPGEILEGVVLMRRILLEPTGGWFWLEGSWPDFNIPDVIRFTEVEEIMAKAKIHRYRSHGQGECVIPGKDFRCKYCDKGWTVLDFHTCHAFWEVVVENHVERPAYAPGIWLPTQIPVMNFTYCHPQCHQEHNNEMALAGFVKIFTEAGFDNERIIFEEVPNRYGSGDLMGQWYQVMCYHKAPASPSDSMRVMMAYAVIEVGWRERVIQISMKKCRRNLNFFELFADQDVTKEQTLIHAHSEEAAVRYLYKIREQIEDRSGERG